MGVEGEYLYSSLSATVIFLIHSLNRPEALPLSSIDAPTTLGQNLSDASPPQQLVMEDPCLFRVAGSLSAAPSLSSIATTLTRQYRSEKWCNEAFVPSLFQDCLIQLMSNAACLKAYSPLLPLHRMRMPVSVCLRKEIAAWTALRCTKHPHTLLFPRPGFKFVW
jgi:hypothetical protein